MLLKKIMFSIHFNFDNFYIYNYSSSNGREQSNFFLFLFYIKKIDFYYLKKFLIFSFFSIVIPIIVLKNKFSDICIIKWQRVFDIYVGYRHLIIDKVSERIFNLPISFDNAGQFKNSIKIISSYIVWFIIYFLLQSFAYFHTKKNIFIKSFDLLWI